MSLIMNFNKVAICTVALLSSGSLFAGNFTKGYCTYGVDSLKSSKINWSGSAKDWYKNAQGKGYKVGSAPKLGAIIVFGAHASNGNSGHVGVIDGLTPLTMSDMNGGGKKCGTVNAQAQCSNTFNKITNKVNVSEYKAPVLGYIYF